MQIGRDHLFAEFADLALARYDTRLGVMSSHGERAIPFEQFAIKRDAAHARLMRGQRRCGDQIADNKGPIQQLSWQTGQRRVLTADDALGGRDHADAVAGSCQHGSALRRRRLRQGRDRQKADASRKRRAPLS